MAVAKDSRRQGLALALLRKCERIGEICGREGLTTGFIYLSCSHLPASGALWGYDSLWLHVSVTNLAAQGLYSNAGFSVADPGLWFTGPLRQILMRKEIEPVKWLTHETTHAPDVSFTGNTTSSQDEVSQRRVYIWRTEIFMP